MVMRWAEWVDLALMECRERGICIREARLIADSPLETFDTRHNFQFLGPFLLLPFAFRGPFTLFISLVFWSARALFLHANHRSLRSYSLTSIPKRSTVRPILQLLSQLRLYLDLLDAGAGAADAAAAGGGVTFVIAIPEVSVDGSVEVAILLLVLRWLSNH
jgi:hypothetical protein